MSDGESRGVVQSLPDRPLTREEGVNLREDARFMDLSYLSVFGEGLDEDDADDAMGLVAILANSGDERHLLGFSPIDEEWQIVWEGSNEEEDGLPFEPADEWAREHWGMSSQLVFDMPAPGEGEG